MELIKFSINHFRRFQRLNIDVNRVTTLVGANNQGKSSICDALCMFFGELGSYRDVSRSNRRPINNRFRNRRIRFDYEKDAPYVPAGKQGKRGMPGFAAVFSLSEDEVAALEKIGVDCRKTSELTLHLKCGSKDKRLNFFHQNSNAETLHNLTKFCRERVKLLLVPAIREDASVSQSIYSLIDETVFSTEETQKILFKAAKSVKESIQKRINKIEEDLLTATKNFIPDAKAISVRWSFDFANAFEISEIYLNDGNSTPLTYKGEGIKSLLMLSQISQISHELTSIVSTNESSRIFLIEEPEAHLNSAILYALRDKLNDIGTTPGSKLILTTHSPIFAMPKGELSTVIVENGQSTIAQSKVDIAKALGIKLAENLRSSEVMLITEGKHDCVAFKELSKTFNDGQIDFLPEIIPAGGATSMLASYTTYKPFTEHIYFLLDNDQAGKESRIALAGAGIPVTKIFSVPVDQNANESELEDVFTVEFLKSIFEKLFERDFSIMDGKRFKQQSNKKFSTWIYKWTNFHGVADKQSNELKRYVWEHVQKHGIKKEDILPNYLPFCQTLFKTLSKR